VTELDRIQCNVIPHMCVCILSIFAIQEFEQSVADRVKTFVGSDCQQLYHDVELIREWLNKPPEG